MSETPQQHGWQPPAYGQPGSGPAPEDHEQAEQASQQRGFGLFETPDAPNELPVFTPFTPDMSSSPSQSSAEEVPFPGFPSEEQPPPPPASSYVPAPAVLPIPGVAHDAFPPDTPSSSSFDGWSGSSYESP